MSMDCDTRLAMMAMADRAQRSFRQPAPRRRTLRVRNVDANTIATTTAAMAAFALTLFTRSA